MTKRTINLSILKRLFRNCIEEIGFSLVYLKDLNKLSNDEITDFQEEIKSYLDKYFEEKIRKGKRRKYRDETSKDS